MNTFIVLFRGINVGGKNLLAMAELKSLLQGEGYKSVKSYIQSGNLVLRSKSNPSKHIAQLVESHFGFKPDVLSIEKTQFENAVRTNPFSTFEKKAVHFFFCFSKPKIDEEKVKSYAAPDEKYLLQDNILYLYAPNGIGRSKLVANIKSCLGVSTTGRNLNTVSKLKEMAKEM